MIEVRQQKAVKVGNIRVRDLVWHMSEVVSIRNIFLVNKWNLAFCLDSCIFFGLALCGCVHDVLPHGVWPSHLCLINPFLRLHFWNLVHPLKNLGRKFLLLCADSGSKSPLQSKSQVWFIAAAWSQLLNTNTISSPTLLSKDSLGNHERKKET